MNTRTTTTPTTDRNKRAECLFVIRDRHDFEGALFAHKHAMTYSPHLDIDAVAAVHRLGSRPVGHRGSIALPEPYEGRQVEVMTTRLRDGRVTQFELDGYYHFWSIGARRVDSNIVLRELIERVRPKTLAVNSVSDIARSADELQRLRPALFSNVDRVVTGSGTALSLSQLLGVVESSVAFTREIQQRLAAGRARQAADVVARPGGPAPQLVAYRKSAPFDTELLNRMCEQTGVTLKARGVQA